MKKLSVTQLKQVKGGQSYGCYRICDIQYSRCIRLSINPAACEPPRTDCYNNCNCGLAC